MLKSMRLLLANAHGQPWQYRLLRFCVHLMLLLRRTPSPKQMNRLVATPEGVLVQGPSNLSETGVLELPGWGCSPPCDAFQAEENAANCEALLLDYSEYLAASGQEELAPTYIARLVEPDSQVDAILTPF